MRKVRCAIYTRKSSEEGLEQEFNSLHAQREACAAYIASQKHEGWVLLPEQYDDGGISGGTLERDGLRRLMAAVAEGLVDQIVVYKIDRLTRSLADFAKLVDRLDGAGASFVSVTQSFNTATSMGRLTLNVLLSFAQFEREVTAERIRDKIAASKKKGLWMGGNVPLGYAPSGRSLIIVNKEAATVRSIYDLYTEHGSITATTDAARRLQLRSKMRRGGKGGNLIGRGHIHAILTNPVYAGRIRHKQTVHPGQHDPIIEPEHWDAIQELLTSEARRQRSRGDLSSGASGQSMPDYSPPNTPPPKERKSNRSALAGKLLDETGDRLTPTHSNKKGRRYRYYVSNRLISAGQRDGVRKADGWRLSAPILEEQLTQTVQRHIKVSVMPNCLVDASIAETESLHRRFEGICSIPIAATSFLRCIERADIEPGRIRITLNAAAISVMLDVLEPISDQALLNFEEPFAIRKRGVEAKLVIGTANAATAADPILTDNLARATICRDGLKRGRTLGELASEQGVSNARIKQILTMAFLAPEVVTAVVRGDQPTALTSKWLQTNALPDDWHDQMMRVSRLR